MTDRGAARLARLALAVIALLFAAGLALSVINGSSQRQSDWGTGGNLSGYLFPVAMFSFPAVGALIASRQRRNAIGWISLAIGFSWALSGVLSGYSTYGLSTNPGSLPHPDLVLALQSQLWVPAIGLIGTFLILLFPDGHLPSRGWRPLAWISAVAMAASAVSVLNPMNFAEAGFPGVDNPIGVEGLRPVIAALQVFVVVLPLCIVGCAVALIQRLRRSRGLERLQLKWLAAGAGAAALVYLLAIGVSLPFWAGGATAVPTWVAVIQDIALYAFVLIPIATGIAIRRYRLYDIDRIINRTLVYGGLTATLSAVYFLTITVSQELFRPLSGDSKLAVAVSTLVVAALMRPARVRMQAFIDRRFYRRKFDAARTVEAFSARLRNEIDLETLTAELLAATGEVMQPAHLSVWLKP